MELFDKKIMNLLAYLSNELNDQERDRFEAELHDSAELRELLEITRTHLDKDFKENYPELKKPSRNLVHQIYVDLFKGVKVKYEKKGVITFDSKLLPLPSGVRPATVTTRRLRFNNEQISLELSLYPITSASYQMIGQVMCSKSDRNYNILLHSTKNKQRCVTNEFNIFQIDRVPLGKCKMQVCEELKAIMVVDLEL
ncbi:MAG: hypothetical protein ACTSW1_15495 [Candidatus Hodarchaeales archaeon]